MRSRDSLGPFRAESERDSPVEPMKLWYQSYVDYENGASYWDKLRLHLDDIIEPGTTIDIRGITPFDSYAHPLVEFRCAREMICNAVRAEREGYDAFIVGHFQDAGLYEAASLGDRVWRFEPICEGECEQGAHPHFVCVDCGGVFCLNEIKLTKKSLAASRRVGEIAEILLRGHCKNCA